MITSKTIMNRLIYILPIILTLSACGGGSTDEMTDEELSQYPEQSIQEQHNEMTGRKGIMPVDCVKNPQLCV